MKPISPDASLNFFGKFYDEHAPRVADDSLVEPRRRIVLEIISRRMKAGQPLSILDVGSGGGDNLVAFRDRLRPPPSRLVGIDVSQKSVDRCRDQDLIAHIVDLNAGVIPESAGSFDVVTLLEVIEHVYNSDHLMMEIRRVLKPGGLLVLSTPNLASWANRFALVLGFQPYSLEISFLKSFGTFGGVGGTVGHIKAFTLRSLREYLEYLGFRICSESATGAAGIPRRIEAIDRLFTRFPMLASHVVVAAIRGEVSLGRSEGLVDTHSESLTFKPR